MLKECSLIATIPNMNNLNKVEEIIKNPHVKEIRWNTGIITPFSELETLKILLDLSALYNKKLWVDIKGRQLRVTEWGAPLYSSIKLNHNVEITGSAQVILRGESPLNLISVKNNEIFVSPLPRHAVGAGQSVNIIPANTTSKVNINGYLTESDISYLEACKVLEIKNIMASFIERKEDIQEIKSILNECEIICKIESKKGLFELPEFAHYTLMAARDDLYIELNHDPYKMQHALKNIIHCDPHAICASRIFTSLEHSDNISFADFEDLENNYKLGYRQFMLCDNICNYRFEKAIKGWEMFINHV